MIKFQDFPLKEIQEAVAEHVASGRSINQKFTCSGCGKRLTVDKPNVLYKKAECEDCSTTTNIEETGCNYQLRARVFGDDNKRSRKG